MNKSDRNVFGWLIFYILVLVIFRACSAIGTASGMAYDWGYPVDTPAPTATALPAPTPSNSYEGLEDLIKDASPGLVAVSVAQAAPAQRDDVSVIVRTYTSKQDYGHFDMPHPILLTGGWGADLKKLIPLPF